MNNLESLFSMLSNITIEDISQAPHKEQPKLVDNIEDLQDRLKAILSATGQPHSTHSTIH